MASTMSSKRARTTKREVTRRSSKVGDMTREELRELLIQVIDERLPSIERMARPETEDLDWIAAARQVRGRARVSPDSTPLLRALREERAQHGKMERFV